MTDLPVIDRLRREFHADLRAAMLTASAGGVASNAAKDSRLGRNIAAAIIDQIRPAG